MPRKPTITCESVVELLERVERPFVDPIDISEHLDVTPQAVRNKHGDLGECSMLESGDAGQTRVYWLKENATVDESNANQDATRWTEQEIRDLIQQEIEKQRR